MTFNRLYPSMKFLFLCLLQATPLAAQNFLFGVRCRILTF
jgi:hypothetical protein